MEPANKKKPTKKVKKPKAELPSTHLTQTTHTHMAKKRRVPKPGECLPHVLYEQIQLLKERVEDLEKLIALIEKK